MNHSSSITWFINIYLFSISAFPHLLKVRCWSISVFGFGCDPLTSKAGTIPLGYLLNATHTVTLTNTYVASGVDILM
jgi:hypothetical protein